MLVLPWLLLLLLELALRLGSYGGSYPLFVTSPHPEYLVPNPEVARRYFRDRTLTPLPHLDAFRARRGPATFRIVFQGESSAAGFPYRHGGAPSRMLAQRLQATFPDRDIEVVNTALTAINSYTLLDLADEIIAQRPDAVLIYTGHNEYYGVFGVGSTRSAGRRRPLIRAYLALSRLRIFQLLDHAIAAGSGALKRRDTGAAPGTVMELLAGEQRIPLGSGLYREGLEQFRANLGELLSRYSTRGIPVFIGTVASNERDQEPFVTGFAPGADSAGWWRSYRAGLAALERGDARAAERALRTAVRVDGTAAAAFHAMGKLFDSRGDSTRARWYYRAAKERDQLRFRAPEAINRIIREEAARHGATVVETQRALERASPGGAVGRSLMLEHLHPNLEGYFLIADAFYESLRKRGMIGSWEEAVPAAQARREIPVTPVDSLVGLFRVDRLLAGWPFQPAGRTVTPTVDTLRPRTVEEALAQEVVRGTLPWPEAMDRLKSHYERAGDPEGALRVARAMAQEYRAEAEPLLDAGRIALSLGRRDEALRYARAAYTREETAETAQLIGVLLLQRNDQPAAVQYLRRAAQLAPGNEPILLTLAAAEAIPALERARARAPRDPDILFRLATAYVLTRQNEKSRTALAALREVDPDHAGARDLLGRLPP
ncbi:MAG TPA: tetratricopeptide repeat protein [Longimicrobiaceae bacterium]|nr:tetratricopeptide repeat protein [Longimicrobiaceae bacterium]